MCDKFVALSKLQSPFQTETTYKTVMENAPHITYHAIVLIYYLLWNYWTFSLTKFWLIFDDVFTSVTINLPMAFVLNCQQWECRKHMNQSRFVKGSKLIGIQQYISIYSVAQIYSNQNIHEICVYAYAYTQIRVYLYWLADACRNTELFLEVKTKRERRTIKTSINNYFVKERALYHFNERFVSNITGDQNA